jgi:hypothetical protein
VCSTKAGKISLVFALFTSEYPVPERCLMNDYRQAFGSINSFNKYLLLRTWKLITSEF